MSPGPYAADLSEVAVVTVTYHAAGFIHRSLDALPLAELAGTVIVDNASDDGIAAVLAPYLDRGVVLVDSPANIGFGAGNNVGAQHAPAARWFLFLNPDAVLAPDDLRALVSYASEHTEAAVVGPRVFDDGVALTSAGAIATMRSELAHHGPPLVRRLGVERRLPATYDRSGPVGYVEGGCMLVERDAFERLGGFDERFFLCYEESDLARRVVAAGREVHLCAAARVQHHPGTTRDVQPFNSQVEVWRSAGRYVAKWNGPLVAGAFRSLVAARLVAKAGVGRVSPSELRRGLAAVFGRPAVTRRP